MRSLEQFIIDLLLKFASIEEINGLLSDRRFVPIFIVALVAFSGAWLGSFLLLRKMSMTSDAISHTVLLGIVVSFLIMVYGLHQEPDLSSPWLIIGAAMAGLATVVLTELVHHSGLVKEDAALGLIFPLLFAVSILLVSRYTDNVHLDQDSVILGEVGLAWANTNNYCYDNCEDIVITPDDPRAKVAKTCINCKSEGLSPHDAAAVFEEYCSNCGRYSAAKAWSQRLIPEPPVLIYWPKAITVMGLITLINILFVLLFYKELKLSTFDAALAATLGFKPNTLHYALMVLVSVTAVGAFDAVGAVLVVAFFIIPAASAYLLTDRLSLMLLISPLVGILGAYTGYDFAHGSFLGIFHMNSVLEWVDKTIGLDGYTNWNTSFSAAMVIMTFFFFILTWFISPRYGLLSGFIRRANQRQHFADQLLLAHLANHQNTPEAAIECKLDTLPEHLNWSSTRIQRVVSRLRLRQQVRIEHGILRLTEKGAQQAADFSQNLIQL